MFKMFIEIRIDFELK